MNDLEKELSALLNSVSREDDSNTPDFILAELMIQCLDAFELASNKRESWYGITLDISNDWKCLILQAIGEASMCWSETPKGIFDSTKAEQIGIKLLKDIKAGPSIKGAFSSDL